MCVANKISRFDVILSLTMNKNIITLANEIVDPTDEIMYNKLKMAVIPLNREIQTCPNNILLQILNMAANSFVAGD